MFREKLQEWFPVSSDQSFYSKNSICRLQLNTSSRARLPLLDTAAVRAAASGAFCHWPVL